MFREGRGVKSPLPGTAGIEKSLALEKQVSSAELQPTTPTANVLAYLIPAASVGPQFPPSWMTQALTNKDQQARRQRRREICQLRTRAKRGTTGEQHERMIGLVDTLWH